MVTQTSARYGFRSSRSMIATLLLIFTATSLALLCIIMFSIIVRWQPRAQVYRLYYALGVSRRYMNGISWGNGWATTSFSMISLVRLRSLTTFLKHDMEIHASKHYFYHRRLVRSSLQILLTHVRFHDMSALWGRVLSLLCNVGLSQIRHVIFISGF
jgi:hypothetical protein